MIEIQKTTQSFSHSHINTKLEQFPQDSNSPFVCSVYEQGLGFKNHLQ